MGALWWCKGIKSQKATLGNIKMYNLEQVHGSVQILHRFWFLTLEHTAWRTVLITLSKLRDIARKISQHTKEKKKKKTKQPKKPWKACGKAEGNFQHRSTSETAKTLDKKLASKEDEELSTFGFELDARASKLNNELLRCFMLSVQIRSSLWN